MIKMAGGELITPASQSKTLLKCFPDRQIKPSKVPQLSIYGLSIPPLVRASVMAIRMVAAPLGALAVK
jgi:hypothetical protein